MDEVAARIGRVFAAAGARGFIHAREVGVTAAREVGVNADQPVVLASVFKIAVAVAFWAEVSAGRIDERERATVDARFRVGGIGTAGCADDVSMSWRDLAHFMLTMSDNAATDVIYRRIGKSAVDQVLVDLGLRNTRIIGCCEDLFGTVAGELGVELADGDIDSQLEAATDQQVWALDLLDPARTTASTAREITALLDAIWTDRAAAPGACAHVRSIMQQQIWPHRLRAGFDSDVEVAAKTGTLPAVRNEAGVVSYPDGRRYAVAVFTRAQSLAEHQPRVDSAIGQAARLAVDHLRGVMASAQA
jgi:beta-lactamase class A